MGLAAAAIALTACAAVTVIGYLVERQSIIAGIDSRLLAAAAAVPEILPTDYHRRIYAGEPIPESEYLALIDSLNEFVARAHLPYVYTYIAHDGDIYLTSANQTPRMLAADRIRPQLTIESDPPPGVRQSLKDGQVRYIEYTTRAGSFRSIFLPVEVAGGDRYVIGADVTLDFMQASLIQRLVQASLVGVIVTVAVGAVGAWLAGRIAHPVAQLAGAIDALGAGDGAFGAGSADDDLQQMAQQRVDETGRLAASMLAMQQRLRRHIAQLEQLTREQQRMQTQLEIARRIQQGLLPRTPPQLDGIEVRGWNQAADSVGGDFYDWIIDPREGVDAIVLLADATGHGVGAALTAATCRAHARDLLRRTGPSLGAGLGALSDAMLEQISEGHFITLLAAAITGNRIAIASAGQGPILLWRAAEARIEYIDASGPPLGVVPEIAYGPDHACALAPGDTLLVVSDGVFEAAGPGGEQFGRARLEAALRDSARYGPEGLIAGLRTSVAAFAGSAAAADDMTIVVVRAT